jgi:hypothetical protein
LQICNQEKRKIDSVEIKVEERRREDTSEEEDEFSNTLQGRVSISISPTTSNW